MSTDSCVNRLAAFGSKLRNEVTAEDAIVKISMFLAREIDTLRGELEQERRRGREAKDV